MKINTINNLI